LVCGILVWDYLEVVQEDFQPFPGMQDYLCLALLPLFIAAFFHFRAETPYARAALRKLCNLAILLCGATVVLLLLKPHTVLAVSESPAWILTAAAYLVLSVGAVSFGVTCWVLYVGPAERRVLLITLLGLAAHSAGNFIYGYSVFRKNFAVGGAADFLWLLSFALIAWAAWEQRGQSPQALQPSRKDAPRPRLEELEATLPAVVIGAILLTAFLMREDLPRAVWNLLLPLLALLAVFVAVREWWSWHVESRLHAELQRSEARFRQVVDSNMSGIMFWRADGLVLDANEAFLEMAGYTRQDLENGRVTWEQLTPCEFRELCQAAFQEITATGNLRSVREGILAQGWQPLSRPRRRRSASAGAGSRRLLRHRSFGDQSGAPGTR
jgi:PAS domain-containing protein